ncbi:hypothetical protein AB0469_40540 [Streptomyces sp. NPDC093801]|uniref:hypothetical protein n=1 Tax=Streptomyces sp. NPDC093801 TaxID=3155203 RepID=UPI00344CA5ED
MAGEGPRTPGPSHESTPTEQNAAPQRAAPDTDLQSLEELPGELGAQEHLVAVDEYKGWPMYSTEAARGLDVEVIRPIVAKRVAWEEATTPPR